MAGSREIPMFTFDDALVVESLFARRGIRWRKEVVHLDVTPWGGSHAYTFHVSEDDFAEAIDVLKEAFGLRTGSEAVSGTCPACGAAIAGAQRCPACDLNVSGDYAGYEPRHPFVRFLQDSGLL